MPDKDLTGLHFGRWTVLGKANSTGESRWHCQCECGTERDVLERSLKYGSSKSCGCLTKERTIEALSADYSGRRFGRLVALERSEKSRTGANQWKCRCDCGKECVVLQRSLQNGRRTSCGCDSRKGKSRVKDITGQKFRMLTALYPTSKRRHNGSILWHCRCECGNEVDAAADDLLYNPKLISCGCAKKKCNQELGEKLVHIAGTSIDAIRSEKVRSDSTTGVRGVYMRKGKFRAIITFQQKCYFLGSYETLEMAAQARKAAEEALFESTVDFYDQWKKRADADPEWASLHPMNVHVTQNAAGEFRVELLPSLEEINFSRKGMIAHG